MQGWYEPLVRQFIGQLIRPDSAIGTILIGEFGVLTMTVTYIVGLMLPLVLGFYFFLSLLEDSGYLPRIAVLTDRLLSGLGLNGRAIIPIILGFGCVTVAMMTTRLLGTEREKRIAVFLLGLAIPCSAQLGVIMGVLSGLGSAYVALYLVTIIIVMVLAGTLLNKILPGESSELLIDLPGLRLPRLSNVLQKTFIKSTAFLKEATPLFALGALIIGILQVSGALELIQELFAPVTVGFLTLPKEAATAFVMGIVRRDFGAAGLMGMNLSNIQTVIALITITLFVPCIASVLMIFKERGKKEAALMWLGTWVIAFTTGGIIAQLYRLLKFVDGGYDIQMVIAALATFMVIMVGILRRFEPLNQKLRGCAK